VWLRMADAHHTDLPLAGVASDNPCYTLRKEACFGKLDIGGRISRLGPHPESGSSLSIASVWSSRLAPDRQALDRAFEFDGQGQ
jgi:hypothetical protein